MKTQLTGIVVDGALQLDQSIDLPSNVRVNVTIEPMRQPNVNRIAAWESLKQRIRDRPIDFGGKHFTRDELRDRD